MLSVTGIVNAAWLRVFTPSITKARRAGLLNPRAVELIVASIVARWLVASSKSSSLTSTSTVRAWSQFAAVNVTVSVAAAAVGVVGSSSSTWLPGPGLRGSGRSVSVTVTELVSGWRSSTTESVPTVPGAASLTAVPAPVLITTNGGSSVMPFGGS